MGTPANTDPATMPTKKISRLALPSPASAGCSASIRATTPPTSSSARPVVRHWPCSTSRSSAISVISAVLTGSAAARHTLGISSAAVVT